MASSFTQMILKRVDAMDTNPVKIAFGIAMIVLQIKDVCWCSSHWCLANRAFQDVKGNIGVVEHRIMSTLEKLRIL